MSTTTEDPPTRVTAAADNPVAVALVAVNEALDSAAQVPVWSLTEAQLQAGLSEALAVRARVEQLTSRLLGSVESRELPRVAGCSSTRAWLASKERVSVGDGARLVKAAGVHRGVDDPLALDGLGSRTGAVRAAWAVGTVSTEQAVLIASTVDWVGPDVAQDRVAKLQDDLVSYAQLLSFTQLQIVCRHAVEVVDPDAADATLERQLAEEEKEALAAATFRYRRTNGEVAYSGRMPAAQFAMLLASLEAIAAPRHHTTTQTQPQTEVELPGTDTAIGVDTGADSGAGTEAQPEAVVPVWDDGLRDLTYQQRLGRAMCTLVEHLPTDELPKRGMTNADIVVTLDLTKLQAGVGEAVLDTGIAMSTGHVRRLGCNARLIPAVLDGDSAVLDVGLGQRLFTHHQRIALGLRDHGCIWPGCDRPPAGCEAHHITWWSHRGPTDLANGCLLCPYHHHLVHSNADWAVRMAADGVPEITPPLSQDPTRRPRRHQRFTYPR